MTRPSISTRSSKAPVRQGVAALFSRRDDIKTPETAGTLPERLMRRGFRHRHAWETDDGNSFKRICPACGRREFMVQQRASLDGPSLAWVQSMPELPTTTTLLQRVWRRLFVRAPRPIAPTDPDMPARGGR